MWLILPPPPPKRLGLDYDTCVSCRQLTEKGSSMGYRKPRVCPCPDLVYALVRKFLVGFSFLPRWMIVLSRVDVPISPSEPGRQGHVWAPCFPTWPKIQLANVKLVNSSRTTRWLTTRGF